jgi:glycosyltransferase involved in cell wall biosynthesis
MHIGFIALDYPSEYGGGGVGTLIQTLARELVKRGHHVAVIALATRGEPLSSNDEGVEVHRFRQGNLHWYFSKIPVIGDWGALSLRELERAWGGWQTIQKLHKQQPFDVIEITEQGGFFLPIFLQDVPLVARLHGEEFTFCKYTPDCSLTIGIRLNRVFQRFALRRTQYLISPSKSHAKEIEAELDKISVPIAVVPNTVQFKFKPSEMHKNADQPSNAPLVLYVGRLQRVKGIPLLLEAAHYVLQAKPETQFVLAGAPHPSLSPTDINNLLQRYNLNGQVRFSGHIPRSDLLNWYQQATLCVLPSYYETFGMAALEPMILGVPIVVSNAGALPEVVQDGVTGLIVPAGDALAMANAILKLITNNTLRCELRSAARNYANNHFNLDDVVNRTLDVYCRVS